MASALSDVIVGNLSGNFDLQKLVTCNLLKLGRFVVDSFENTFNFCSELKLINAHRTCQHCRRQLKLSCDRRQGHATPVTFRCMNKACPKHSNYYSIRAGSFFDGSNLPIEQTLIISYLYCANIKSYDQIRQEAQTSESRLSYSTIADWLTYCREVALEVVARETPKLIGGPGLTVEVDESKFGKRKYNKGRLVIVTDDFKISKLDRFRFDFLKKI